MRLELKAEEQACSGSPGGPVTPNKQTGKQSKWNSHMVHYGPFA